MENVSIFEQFTVFNCCFIVNSFNGVLLFNSYLYSQAFLTETNLEFGLLVNVLPC